MAFWPTLKDRVAAMIIASTIKIIFHPAPDSPEFNLTHTPQTN
jgi:hypothetical protein